MFKGLLVIFTILITLPVMGGAYEGLYLGEKNPPDYNGPNSPVIHFNLYKSEVQLVGKIEDERPVTNKIMPELLEMEQFLTDDFLQSSLCSNESLVVQADYMRYLFRLLSLSYLYESLQQSRETLMKLGVQDHTCYFSWKEFLNQCQPKTEEMKKFKRRAGQVVDSYQFILPQDHSFKKYMSEWQERLKKGASDLPLTMKRLKLYCERNKVNCKLGQLDSLNRAMHGVCSEDWTLFKNLCSEEDLVYGMSRVKLAQELILNSNVYNVLNTEGNARECIDRFSKLWSKLETRHFSVEKMFPAIYFFTKNNLPPRFLHGRLFLPGALKEFDDKGLKEFLFAESTPTPTIAPTVVIAVVKKTPTPTPSPTPTPKVVKTATPIPVVTKAPIKKSIFLLASEKLDRERLKSIDLDMEVLRDDFILTDDFKEKMSTRLKPFQTRQALSDMKTFDLLGTKEVPMKLLFLKYLIETNQHQGLFNIKSVLGNVFFVQNDIDRLGKGFYPARLIELKNDESTGNKWLITILHESRAIDIKPSETKKP